MIRVRWYVVNLGASIQYGIQCYLPKVGSKLLQLIFSGWLYTYRKIRENNREKQKVYSGIFRITSFAFRAPFFAFLISHQGRHSHEKSKDFVIYFLTALIKHEIRMKYEKCFVFRDMFHKIPTKYKKCVRPYRCTVYSIKQHSILKWNLVH